MRSTGIIRRLDDLGRVVIPREIRQRLELNEGDLLELFFDENAVTFKKYSYEKELVETLESVESSIIDEFALNTKKRNLLLKKLDDLKNTLLEETDND